MALKRLAVVLGATRGQGGSVVNSLLRTGQYRVRGVTEDAGTPDAHRLKERGVEVEEVNLNDPSTLTVAFTSAHVIFAVTTMYHGEMEREVAQGKNIANAAAGVDTIEHFVWLPYLPLQLFLLEKYQSPTWTARLKWTITS